MLPVMLVDVPSAAREGSRRDANRVVGFAGSKASYREACSRKGRIQTVHDARWGVLAAGTAAGSLTGGLHGGKKQTDENADDRDHGKQFHERKRTAIPTAPSVPPSWWRAKSWTQRIATAGKHPCSPETVFSRKPRRSLPDFRTGRCIPSGMIPALFGAEISPASDVRCGMNRRAQSHSPKGPAASLQGPR